VAAQLRRTRWKSRRWPKKTARKVPLDSPRRDLSIGAIIFFCPLLTPLRPPKSYNRRPLRPLRASRRPLAGPWHADHRTSTTHAAHISCTHACTARRRRAKIFEPAVFCASTTIAAAVATAADALPTRSSICIWHEHTQARQSADGAAVRGHVAGCGRVAQHFHRGFDNLEDGRAYP